MIPVRRLSIFLVFALTLVFAASAHAYVYWGDYQGGTVGRANLDGTGVEDGFIQTGGHPNAVAVNSSHIYWSNETAGTIGRANINGTEVEPSFITGIKAPFGVAVNSSSIFWVSLESKAIGHANLDGSGKNLALVSAIGGRPLQHYDRQWAYLLGKFRLYLLHRPIVVDGELV